VDSSDERTSLLITSAERFIVEVGGGQKMKRPTDLDDLDKAFPLSLTDVQIWAWKHSVHSYTYTFQ